MRRQTFIKGIAVLAAVWALGTRAQHSGMPTVCGSIGVQVRPMTAAFAYSLGMTEIYGAIFRQPKRGGPAAMAGIEAGDVVSWKGDLVVEELEEAETIQRSAASHGHS